MEETYLPSVIKQFEYYKNLGDRTIEQLSIDELKKEYAEDSNSIAIVVKHLAGNMQSRWTNFLTEDGEKAWRKRDEEFIDDFNSKEQLILTWNNGWNCLLSEIKELKNNNLNTIIYIRNQGHSVTEAINRQMMHYAYHVGQIVFIGKLTKGSDWQSLSIPKGESKQFNISKFKQEKSRKHFTDDV
ncbi:DinB family protein [Winogradskyella sp. 4-2091]|uniref:DinB family protein n=1 Tax=Winogradskyella sp. 4-2091 TaxID=3381659 RepID=UPI0038914375